MLGPSKPSGHANSIVVPEMEILYAGNGREENGNWKMKPIRFQKRQISNKRTNQMQKVLCHAGLRFSYQKGILLDRGYERETGEPFEGAFRV